MEDAAKPGPGEDAGANIRRYCPGNGGTMGGTVQGGMSVAKRFHVANPGQLKALVPFAKTNAPSLEKMVRIWYAAQRKGKNRWDNAIYVGFSGDRHREAGIVRIGANNELVTCATLMYNKALGYCECNMRRVFD